MPVMSGRNTQLMSSVKTIREGAELVLDESSFWKFVAAGEVGDSSHFSKMSPRVLYLGTLPVRSKRSLIPNTGFHINFPGPHLP